MLIDSQFKLPIKLCVYFVILAWFGDDLDGIESTGSPFLYGVLVEITALPSRLEILRR